MRRDRTARCGRHMLNEIRSERKAGWKMNSFFESGPLPDWKTIQEWLGRDMPWKLVKQWDKRRDASWLNDYVKNMMQHSKNNANAKTNTNVNANTKASSLPRLDVRKDAKFVTVTMQLDSERTLRSLQLFATSERLRILGLPNDGRQSIRFPCLVLPRSGRASVKKDRLVVRFKRRPPERNEYELFIEP